MPRGLLRIVTAMIAPCSVKTCLIRGLGIDLTARSRGEATCHFPPAWSVPDFVRGYVAPVHHMPLTAPHARALLLAYAVAIPAD